MNNSLSKRSIYPSLSGDVEEDPLELSATGNYFTKTLSKISRGDFPSAQELEERGEDLGASRNGPISQTEVNDILEAYYEDRIGYVIERAKGIIDRAREVIRSDSRIGSDNQNRQNLVLLKTLLGMSLLKRYKKRKDISLLESAQKLLREDCHIEESPFRKAKRLNNIGVCQLMRKHYSDGFKYFSKAFEIYREDKNLNFIGLVRNISEVYREWEMYEESARFYDFILQEHDRKNFLAPQEEITIVINILTSINSCIEYQERKAVFHRADKWLKKLEGRKGEEETQVRLKLEIIKYSIKWGLLEGDISRDSLQKMVRDIDVCEDQSRTLAFLKGCCYLKYREVHFGSWQKYKEYSEVAGKLFDFVASSSY